MRILVSVLIPTHFRILFPTVRRLVELSAFEILFHFPRFYPSREEDMLAAIEAGYPVFDAHGGRIQDLEPASQAVQPSPSSRTGRLSLANFPLTPLVKLCLGYVKAHQVLSKLRPDIILLAEDNIEYYSGVFILAARHRKIPVLITPYTIPNPSEAALACSLKPFKSCRRAINRLIGDLLPRWRTTFHGQAILRCQWFEILAFEAWGIAPPNPWVVNSGFADCIAVESEEMRQRYLTLGFPPAQLRYTGSVTDDLLAHDYPDVPELAVVCSFPPDQFPYYWNENWEYTSYEEMLSAWIGAVKESVGATRPILYVAHPLILPATREMLERRHGIEFWKGPTYAVIPSCSLYIACISATMRWALAAGKPVIDYDVYQGNYGDYAGERGVQTVRSLDELRASLQRFSSGELPVPTAEDALRWGMLDGRSGARLAALTRELAHSAAVARQLPLP